MNLVPKAGKIAWQSYSMWGQYLSLMTLLVPAVLYGVWGVDTNPYLWGKLAILFGAFGIIGRVVDQRIAEEGGKWRLPKLPMLMLMALILILVLGGMSKPVDAKQQEDGPPSAQEFIQVAVPLTAKWEGEHRCSDDPSMHCAYLDRIARPPVWTACYGQTQGIGPGMRFTDAECQADLANGLLRYRAAMHKRYTAETLNRRLTVLRDWAYTDLAWNVGIGGAGGSTAVKRLNRGDIPGGCQAITWWNKAGQFVIRGLVRRRGHNFKGCMDGYAT